MGAGAVKRVDGHGRRGTVNRVPEWKSVAGKKHGRGRTSDRDVSGGGRDSSWRTVEMNAGALGENVGESSRRWSKKTKSFERGTYEW